MINFSSTYRKIWVAGVLAFYLVASFQFSLLEGLHFLSHLKNGCTGDNANHSYFEHVGQAHQHQSLSVFEEIISHPSEDDSPVESNNNLEVKKNPQINPVFSYLVNINRQSVYSNFATISKFSQFFLSIPTPPPQFS